MLLYKYGTVIAHGKTYVIFESNGNGLIVYVAHPDQFIKNKQLKLYLYHQKNETNDALFGFAHLPTRVLFVDLMTVSGVGPKTALTIIRQGPDHVRNMIGSGDAIKLAKIPWIGSRTAAQIILSLQSKYQHQLTGNVNLPHRQPQLIVNDVAAALKQLGFKTTQINSVLPLIDQRQNLEDAVAGAVKQIVATTRTKA